MELGFLRQVIKKLPRLFFVLNKIDCLDDRELEVALSFYQRVLAEEDDCHHEFSVFCVSARKGLEARTVTGPDRWAARCMAKLESFMADFVLVIGGRQIKTGSGCRSERIAKYNRLLAIKAEFDRAAAFDNPPR